MHGRRLAVSLAQGCVRPGCGCCSPQAKQFQAQEQMTSAAAEQMVGELMAQNQAVVDEMARLQDERDGLQVGQGGCVR